MLVLGLVLDALRLPPRARRTSPAGLALPLGVARARLLVYSRCAGRDHGAARPRARALRGRLARRAGLRARRSSRGCGSSTREAGGELGRAGAVDRGCRRRDRSLGGLGAAYAVQPADGAPARRRSGAARDPTRADARRRHRARRDRDPRDHVTLRNVTVVGGENGIDIEHAEPRHARPRPCRSASTLDGIHVRRAGVMIEDCYDLRSPAGPLGAGDRHLVLDGQGDEHGRAAARSPARARASSRTRRWST